MIAAHSRVSFWEFKMDFSLFQGESKGLSWIVQDMGSHCWRDFGVLNGAGKNWALISTQSLLSRMAELLDI